MSKKRLLKLDSPDQPRQLSTVALFALDDEVGQTVGTLWLGVVGSFGCIILVGNINASALVGLY